MLHIFVAFVLIAAAMQFSSTAKSYFLISFTSYLQQIHKEDSILFPSLSSDLLFGVSKEAALMFSEF